MANCDRWTALKFLEVACTLACLIFKSVTDDEAFRLNLYLQKLSREWSLLNNVTWSSVGAAVANVTYGGYFIITSALFIGRLTGEHPTPRRITEFILLGVGAIMFIVLGSLEFAALDAVPHDLVDNAAVIGTLSLITGALFLVDMGGPKAKKVGPQAEKTSRGTETRQQVYNIEEKEPEVEKKQTSAVEKTGNGEANGRYRDSMYKRIRDEKPKSFGIYGKDAADGVDEEAEEVEEMTAKMVEHSPVWSKIRKGREMWIPLVDGQYGKYDILPPSYLNLKEQHPDDNGQPPSSPGDPGYVQYTAQHWGEHTQKTPRQSPTQV